jgi:hypothetical protein
LSGFKATTTSGANSSEKAGEITANSTNPKERNVLKKEATRILIEIASQSRFDKLIARSSLLRLGENWQNHGQQNHFFGFCEEARATFQSPKAK